MIKPYKKNNLVNEGIMNIQEKFKTRDSVGPQWVADFLLSGEAGEERDRVVTDAYMQVNAFLTELSG